MIAVGQRLDDELLVDVDRARAAALHDGAARGRGQPHPRRRRRRPLPLPPRAAARGRRRRPAARRADGDRPAARARRSRHAPERDGPSVYVPAAIAHHYAVGAATSRRRCAPSVRAADAAERVHAYGQAARAARARDRAVRPRARRRGAGRAPTASSSSARRPTITAWRATRVARRRWPAPALELVDERAEPHPTARLLESLRDAQWQLGRGERGAGDDRARAVAAAARARCRPSGPRCWRRRPRALMLRGKHEHAIEVARETLAAADVLDDQRRARACAERAGDVADGDGRGRAGRRGAARGGRARRARSASPDSRTPPTSTSPTRCTWPAGCARPGGDRGGARA